MEHTEDCRTIEELRLFVHETLCARENLLPDQFALKESRLTRGGRLCGLQFSVDGPRSVRLAAIWTEDHNVVYFYDARGNRYLKVRITQRLEDVPSAA